MSSSHTSFQRKLGFVSLFVLTSVFCSTQGFAMDDDHLGKPNRGVREPKIHYPSPRDRASGVYSYKKALVKANTTNDIPLPSFEETLNSTPIFPVPNAGKVRLLSPS